MTLYLIRHAQSQFNAAFSQDPTTDPMIFDSPLSEFGEQQARETREHVRQLNIDRIIVSPFTRFLQTASLIFGETRPFEINADVREQLIHSCDVGRPPHELAVDFPHLGFNHLEDCWWHDGEKDHNGIAVEPNEVLQQRADQYAAFLKAERYHSTAIVSHGNFIRALTGIQPENCQILEFNPK